MRITEIKIEQLFGMFNYIIPIRLKEGITIIHGPNGYGKTTVLKMIDALFNEKWHIFIKVPFKSFIINLDIGDCVKIERFELTDENNESEFKKIKLTISMPKSGNKPFDLNYYPTLIGLTEKRRILARYNYFQVDPVKGLWMYEPSEEVMSFDEIISRNGSKIFAGKYRSQTKKWFLELIKKFNIVFIETQRLMVKEEKGKRYRSKYTFKSTVITYSDNLKKLIQNELTDYAELSQSLDRSFPARLVKTKPIRKLNEEEIRDKLAYLEEKRKNLMEAGLLDKDISIVTDIDITEIDANTINVLNVYIVDTEQKLAIFDYIYEKISLFSRIINERFLNKNFKINKQEGFIITTKDGRKLDLEDLSSGEKHEIILLYEMLFNAKPNFLILIDEPEISFHVEWQEVFLDNLLEIAKLSNLDIIVATHSPQIINDKWDLTVKLE